MSTWCIPIGYDRTPLANGFEVACEPGLMDDLNAKVTAFLQMHDDYYGLLCVPNSGEVMVDSNVDEMKNAMSNLNLSESCVAPLRVIATETASVCGGLLITRKPKSMPLKRSGPIIDSEHGPGSTPKLQMIATLPPTTISTEGHYLHMQENEEERILDTLPADVAPIELLDRPFGEFCDILDSGVAPEDVHQLDEVKLRRNVEKFAREIMPFEPRVDPNKREPVIHALNDVFEFPLRQHSDVEGFRTDAHSEVGGMISLILDYENLQGIPYVRCVGFVAHSHNRYMDMRARRRIPALALIVHHATVQLYAIISLRYQYHTFPLTPGITAASAERGYNDSFFRAFLAAHVLQRRIHRDLQQYTQPGAPSPPKFGQSEREQFFPAITAIRRRVRANENMDNMRVQFRIIASIAPGIIEGAYHPQHVHSYRAVLTAPVSGYEDARIIVKISMTYGLELHEFCADKGLAPRILGFERLPGGWFAIAMEYLKDASPIDCRSYSAKKEKVIRALVADFHAEGWVHGDLRAENIVCDGDKVWLLDFDWGGRDGEAEFPLSVPLLKMPDLCSGERDFVIRKEYDLGTLDATFEALKHPIEGG